jgi:glucosyl-dolichyl phosphate glucuronosyltransferase
MSTQPSLSATVLICTYNRARLLEETLLSLRDLETSREWDVIVVDNNSTDDTAAVVTRTAAALPVPVRYLFESQQGKSHALNLGIAHARGDVILFTDDDVRVAPVWLDAACEALEQNVGLDYTGGPVYPIWDEPPPRWIDQTHGALWGTLAILDYGAEPFVLESRQRIVLGANMAVRRRLLERIGGFHTALGRRGTSLLGQEQAEFFSRSRAAGAEGLYVPAMAVRHHVPATRLTKSYFRRWWYWKGISRARVDAINQCTELGLDLTRVPHVIGVPRFIWGLLARSGVAWFGTLITRDAVAAARHQMTCAYALGYIRACLSGDHRQSVAPIKPPPAEAAPLSR